MTRRHFACLGAAFLAAALFAGCAKKEDDQTSYNDAPKNTDDHGHSHEHEMGPHGGHIIELTEDGSFHGEIAFDAATRTVTLYVLGSDLKQAVAVDLDAVLLHLEHADSDDEIAMVAAPQAEDAEGKASAFTLAGDKVPAGIDDIEKIHGHVHVTIDGKEYTGNIEHDHDDHGGHGHDDDHHHGDDDKDSAGNPDATEGRSKPF